MLKRLNKLYSALIYLPFALLWTAFILLLFVLISVLSKRWAFRLCAPLWGQVFCRLTPISVTRRGLGNIDPRQSYVVVSNHGSQYDIPLVAGWLTMDLKWVAKEELRYHPFIGTVCWIMGNILIDRSNKEAAINSLQRAKDLLVDGTSLLFFPEGTRGEPNKMLPFKKGAFVIAKELSLPILVVSIVGADQALPKGAILPRAAKVKINIHPPIGVDEVETLSVSELAEKSQAWVQTDLEQGV